MTTLMAERRRSLVDDGRQEALFGGEVLATASRPPWVSAPREVAMPEREIVASRGAVAAPERPPAALDGGVAAQEHEAAAPHGAVAAPERRAAAPAGGVAAPAREPETVVAGDPRSPRIAGAPLAGPTLDDVMSRVWEGLVTGLPAACPVCKGEMGPSASRGCCSSCGTTID